jgi:hypothetical protein
MAHVPANSLMAASVAYISSSMETSPLKQIQKARGRHRRSMSQGDIAVAVTKAKSPKKMTYPGEGVYEGDFDGIKRQGFGTFVDCLGGIYRGMWHEDKPEGFGKKIFHSGDRHEGYYKKGKRCGKGTYLWACGDKYVGDWEEGLMTNYGCFTWANGDQYIGEWRSGKLNGHGRKTFIDGSVIVGVFENGMACGKCKKEFSCGDIFDGQYVDDKRSGYGSYIWRDGSSYTGEWNTDKMTGECIRVNGLSEMTVSPLIIAGSRPLHQDNPEIGFDHILNYKGDVLDGKQHGWGIAVFLDSSRYEGYWVDGVFHGWGKLESAGNIYEGEFYFGHMEGHGMMRYYAQEIEDPITTDDTMADLFSTLSVSSENIEEILSSSIMAQIRNLGEIYVGEWKNDCPDGFGIMAYENRSVYIGDFIMSVREGHGVLLDMDSTGIFKRGIWEDDHLIISM